MTRFKKTGVILAQLAGILALHYVWFGAILPCLWKDRGFPAILQLLSVQHLKLDTFENALNVRSFALSASLLHTTIVGIGVAIGTRARYTVNFTSKILSFFGVVCIGAVATCLLYWCSFHLFSYSFQKQWSYGFNYASFFFEQAIGATDFGHVTAASLTIEFTVAFIIRVCTQEYVGVFPRFASKAIPRSLFSFVVCYFLFRRVLTPRVVRSLAAASGVFSPANIVDTGGVDLPDLKMDEWAALCAAVHTLCIALGMVFHWLTQDGKILEKFKFKFIVLTTMVHGVP